MFWQQNDVEALIAKKKYGKAIKVLREQLGNEKNVFKQQQLADLLVLDGQEREALKILSKMVEDFASRGFISKAIAVLKKIQRIKPDLEGLEEKVTELIRKKADAEQDESPEETPSAEYPDALALASDSLDAPLQPPPPATAAPIHHQTSQTLADSGSPLFRDFSDQELLAFMKGLNLLIFEPGEIIFSEGEAGSSLYVLAGGLLRVYVNNKEGRPEQVRTMQQGEFFGEISLLTGKPRTATITAASHCEILQLDVKTLNTMAQKHPAIPNIIRDFARRRLNSPEEKNARQ